MQFARQLYRFKTIDKLIRQGRTGTAHELATQLHITDITIYRYIREMREMGLDIKFSRKLGSYVYEKEKGEMAITAEI